MVWNRTACRLVLGALLLAAASCGSSGGGGSGRGEVQEGPPRVSRGPQVSLAAPASVHVAWSTSKPAAGAVEYGLDAAFGQVALGLPAAEDQAVPIEGLLPGSRYRYRLLVDGGPAGGEHAFATAPADPEASFRFAVLGDCGSGSEDQARVAARILEADPALVLIAGDVVYDKGAPEQLDPHYFRPFASLIDHIPFYAALGNHDVQTENGRPLLEALYLPRNDEEGSERYYSFDHGAAHFVALDTTSSVAPGSPQRAWLERDLDRTAARWVFVYFHHPPYSSSRHGSNFTLRQQLGPVFDAFRVDVAFSGHDHNYERSFPLRREQVVGAESEPGYADPGGTIYIVTGGGGRSLYGSGRSYFTAHSESAYHFVQVDVDGPVIAITAVRSDGVPMDRITVRKTAGRARR
ncbi:MAG: metallophosphoesterase [Planctomycetes bacterium]|nr:metallophosphoesterase [Planctomycetota bacterium]